MRNLALLVSLSASLFASVDVESIDIFANKTFVNQKIDLNKNSVQLLGEVELEDVRFILDKQCKVNSSDIVLENFKNDSLSINIEDLKEQISKKQNRIKALRSNISFLEKTSITNISTSKLLLETSTFLKEEILNNHNLIYKIEKQIKEDNDKLKKLIAKRTNSKFTKLNYDVNCASEVLISYPIYNISKNGFYNINYDSKEKNLEIKNSSFITQSTGVDFKNIDINLYTYNFVQQLKPNKFIPKYLDIYELRAVPVQAEAMMDVSAVPMKKSFNASALKPSFSYREDSTKSFFKASNVSLISGKKTEVLFAKDKYKAKDSLEIDGYSQSQAFVKVDFTSKKLYGVLNAKQFLDGTYIGRSNLNEIKKEKKSSIYFATNRFIDVKKELIKDMKEEPLFSINKLKTEKIWNYKITNNSNKKQKITLLERVPISKHEDIKIKLTGKTKQTLLEKNGKISFDFELKPKETKVINFGYEIEKPIKN